MTITIADGRGALWQWDTGRRLRVGSGVEQIHYQNRAFGGSVDVDVGTDGTAVIPDELLQDCHTLTAYAYVTDDTGAYTMVQQDFAVHKRAKPAGYVYTPTDQMTLQTIQRQIGDLADLATEEKENLVAAINEVARMGGRMSLRVADGYIQYSTDGGSTWQNLIAVADLEGADGITPHIGDNGNWFLGTTDTGKPSRGEKGDPGAAGKSAYQYAQDGGYTGTEEAFAGKLSQEPFIGTTNDLTPTQVYDAVSAGIPVKVRYFDNTFGLLSYTNFAIAENMNMIVANCIAQLDGTYMLGELLGNKTSNTWYFTIASLAQKTDIPSALPNPNALTFTGAVTGTYNGSEPLSVQIPSAVTDSHINSLIDTKLGVIENGSY